ncbi:hypothetical protein ACOM2C_12375 [Pseudarthrobacter sp. So.54]
MAMSTGGVYRSLDGGSSWEPRNKGISAYFMPDPNPEFGQCVHKIAADAAVDGTAIRAKPPRRLPQRRRRRELGVDR